MIFTDKLCPRCKLVCLEAAPTHNSLSRRDKETMICAACGMEEALVDMLRANRKPIGALQEYREMAFADYTSSQAE